jgi:hypothetical protein
MPNPYGAKWSFIRGDDLALRVLSTLTSHYVGDLGIESFPDSCLPDCARSFPLYVGVVLKLARRLTFKPSEAPDAKLSSCSVGSCAYY